jgi:hypothetical protein
MKLRFRYSLVIVFITLGIFTARINGLAVKESGNFADRHVVTSTEIGGSEGILQPAPEVCTGGGFQYLNKFNPGFHSFINSISVLQRSFSSDKASATLILPPGIPIFLINRSLLI